MINVKRNQAIPKSLQSLAIRKYLDEIEDFKTNTDLPKPKCSEDYRNADIFESFDDCFYTKCYLTEKKFFSSYEMDIEHFLPQSESPDLKYEWANLFPADHDANMAKPRLTPDGGYLNPCEDDVENEILYLIGMGGEKMHFEAKNLENIKAKNTSYLLEKLHNGGLDRGLQKKTAGLRKAIYDKYVIVLENIVKWRMAKDEDNVENIFKYDRILKDHLSRKSSFTMLIRSKVYNVLPEEFFD